MGEAYLFGTGGSVQNFAKAYAVIHGDCPLGCIVVCTNGTKTYTDKSGSGVFVFGVNAGGNWSITINKDGKTRTKNVTVAEEHQIIYVAIKFEILLVDGGKLDEDISGGFTRLGLRTNQYEGAAVPTVTLNADSVTFRVPGTSSGYPSGVVYTSNPIDLTSYSTITVDATASTSANANTWVQWGILAKEPSASSCTWLASKTISNPATGASGTLDISALEGSYYIALFRTYSSGILTIRQFKIE